MAKKAGASFFGRIREEETGLRNRSHLLLAAGRCRRCAVRVRRNEIKCGEEKTPLVFGDIAIVIGGERRERGGEDGAKNMRTCREKIEKGSAGPSPLLSLSLLSRTVTLLLAVLGRLAKLAAVKPRRAS